MMQKVQAYIEKYQMIQRGECIIVGVSGGADSMCLLGVLQSMKDAYSLHIHVVHVNHQMREEAMEEAEYVEQYCVQQGIPYHYRSYSVMEYATSHKVSEEEAGRILRYEAFYELYEELSKTYSCKIALAHHQNDRAETMLFHLARGTGIQGMIGIQPVRDKVIRPLLCLTRSEVEEYVTLHHITYYTDISNLSDRYTRNRIRRHVIPQLETVNGQAVAHINEAGQMLEEIALYLTKQVECAKEYCVSKKAHGGQTIIQEHYMEYEPVIQKQLLYSVMSDCCGSNLDLTAAHVSDVHALLEKQVGKYVTLPRGMIAKREYGGICIMPRGEQGVGSSSQMKYLIPTIPYTLTIEGIGELTFTLKETREISINEQKTYTKCFDYDRIKNLLSLRIKEPDDYIALNQTTSRKSIGRYFIQTKVPREERNQKLLLADGSHIIWILGDRISEAYKITDETARVLQVTLQELHKKKE
ncbi:MAG: tRNA lysidine(34) synthetase TilS [Eubacteriales bacterium]